MPTSRDVTYLHICTNLLFEIRNGEKRNKNLHENDYVFMQYYDIAVVLEARIRLLACDVDATAEYNVSEEFCSVADELLFHIFPAAD